MHLHQPQGSSTEGNQSRVREIDGKPFQPIVCYTLPRTETPALAEEVLKLGIDANGVFSGFRGTADLFQRAALRLLRA
jgi:hypothetical protein